MLLDHLYDGIYLLNSDRKIEFWSRGSERITGFSAEDVVGRTCADNVLCHTDGEGRCLCDESCPVSATLIDGQDREAEVYLHHKDGHRMPVFVRVFPVRGDDGGVIGAAEVFSDVPDRQRLSREVEELHHLAMLDPVTQLANRHYLQARLTSRLAETRRYGGAVGVLFGDIDHFKRVNDTFGHDVGDQALKMVADTLANMTRSFDTIGRWGGDEFLAVVVNVDRDQLLTIADRVRKLIEQSFLFADGGEVRVSASFGAAIAGSEETIESLIVRADRCLYQSKASGRNRVTLAAAA